MNSVGIDVSKGKSTVCILKPYGEVLMKPKDYLHTQTELKRLVEILNSQDEEIHVVMESTGIYHMPIDHLKLAGLQVIVVIPWK